MDRRKFITATTGVVAVALGGAGAGLTLLRSRREHPPRPPDGSVPDTRTNVVDLRIERDGLHGGFYSPSGAQERGPAVLVIGGSSGGDYFSRLQARELARQGIPALAIGYFFVPGRPPTLREIDLEYFASAVTWLERQPTVAPGSIMTVGISRGSEAAMLVAIHFPDLVSGVVAAVPGNVVLCGWPDTAFAAWTIDGVALPFVRSFGPTAQDPRALIAVEEIEGPLMLIGAGADEVWPSSAMAQAMAARRDEHHHPLGHVLLNYEHATHRLGYLAPAPLLAENDPTSAARVDVWPKVLRFVRRDRALPSEL